MESLSTPQPLNALLYLLSFSPHHVSLVQFSSVQSLSRV